MALPTVIHTPAGAPDPDDVGRSIGPPLINSSGEVYVIGMADYDVTYRNNIRAWKASDPTSSFSAVASQSTEPRRMYEPYVLTDVAQTGDTIHVVTTYYTASLFVYYSVLDVSGSGSWSDLNSDGDYRAAIVSAVTADDVSQFYSASIVARASNDLVVAFNGEAQAYHGGDYARIDAAYSSNGTSWTVIDATNDVNGVHYTNAVAVEGSSGRVHILFKNPDNSACYCSTLTSSNTWGERLYSMGTISTYGSNYPLSADGKLSTGTTVAFLSTTVAPNEYTSYHEFTSADTLSAPTNTTIGSNKELRTAGGVGLHALAFDSSNNKHVLYVDDSGSDIYYDLNTGSGWGTDTNERSLSGLTLLSANTYTRSGSEKLAFVYFDGSDLYYDEITLSAAAAGMVMPRRLRGLHHMLVR